jgi:hypothetical protein
LTQPLAARMTQSYRIIPALIALSHSAPSSTVTFTAAELLRLIRAEIELAAPEQVTWVDIAAAMEITGIQDARRLRKRAERWEAQHAKGLIPEIRVHKTSKGHNSHWRFAKEDCERYATDRTKEPLTQPSTDDEDELALEKYLRQAS